MSREPIGNESEAQVNAYKAIKRVEGTLLPLEIQPIPPDSTFTKEQVKITLDDAFILEMDVGVPAPELNEDQYQTWMPYAAEGVEPTKQSMYVRNFLKGNGKEGLGAQTVEATRRGVDVKEGIMKNLYGTRVQLVRMPVMYKFKDKETQELTEHNVEGYTVAEAESGGGADIETYIKSLVVGFNESAITRNLGLDKRANQYPEYKEALNAGVEALAEKLGLVVVNGKVQEAG